MTARDHIDSRWRYPHSGQLCTVCGGEGGDYRDFGDGVLFWESCSHCRACKHEPQPSPIAGMTGADLVGAGYYSISHKFRHIARVPPGADVRELMFQAWKRTHTREEIERMSISSLRSQWLRVYCDEVIVLSDPEWKAFRAAGGQST